MESKEKMKQLISTSSISIQDAVKRLWDDGLKEHAYQVYKCDPSYIRAELSDNRMVTFSEFVEMMK